MSEAKRKRVIAPGDNSSEIPGLEKFLEAGGVIQVLPPEPANPKKFETVSLPKPEKLQRRKLSNYESERVPRGEALCAKLNLGSKDFSNFGGTARVNPLTPGQIHAALAQRGIRDHEEKFLLYVWTTDQQYRSAAWALLLGKLAEIIVDEGQHKVVRKRGIMSAMADTALDNFLSPTKYQDTSDRSWARYCDIGCHKNWQRIWWPRYVRLMSYGSELLARGERILAMGV